jgi:hypothetical protein
MIDPAKKKAAAPSSKEYDKIAHMLLDQSKPLEQRANMLVQIFLPGGADPSTMAGLAQNLLSQMSAAAPAAELAKLKAQFEQALTELDAGPPRPATFIAEADGEIPGPKPRAHVVTPDGQERVPFLREGLKIEDLRRGQTVYLDAKGTTVVGASNRLPAVGPEATFLRRLPDTDQVEVSIRDEPIVLDAAAALLEAIDAGDVTRGHKVLICPHRHFAFHAIPQEQDRRHRFVDRMKIPKVLPSQEIGAPHPCLSRLVQRTRLMLFHPDLVAKYHARNRMSLLLEGPTGSGKTLTIKGYLALFYKMICERTGLPNPDSRCVRVKLSNELSMWLGQTDKNFDLLFSDIEMLAAQPVATATGEKILLPVVVILEEVEGVARRRSEGEYDGTGGVMDRILTTLLQRLDDPLDELGHLPIIFISTSNRPGMIDMAMFRRLGGRVAHFRRLDQRGLAAVLDKKIKSDLPLVRSNGQTHEADRARFIDQVVAQLFSPQTQSARIELTLRDGTKIKKFAYDFLTGAIVEQALSEALDEIMLHAAQTGRDDVGLASADLVRALDRQINAMVKNITPYNAADYVDLPEHTQVANVRRLSPTNGHVSRLVAGQG